LLLDTEDRDEDELDLLLLDEELLLLREELKLEL